MDNNQNYNMIFKRKSFHFFRETETISELELNKINEKLKDLKPLYNEIKTEIRIIPAKERCKRGEEYQILFYSENKDNYLQNIGYIGEQLDLFLVSLDIGTLWYGIGKPDLQTYNNLEYVIMILISKMPKDKFRKDMFKSKRKTLDEIWIGEYYKNIGEIVRFTPSACNTQPWKIFADEKTLTIYRYKKPGKRGIMPVNKVIYYNKIDIGIFLFILETCLEYNNISFKKELFIDISNDDIEETLFAKYNI
jgi:hypothetical protein